MIKQKISDGMPIEDSIVEAQQLVLSMFGLGLTEDANLLLAPSLLTEDELTTDQETSVYRLRKSIEAFSTIIHQLHETLNEPDLTTADLIDLIALDITDGELDSSDNSGSKFPYSQEHLARFSQYVNAIEIPNTDGTPLTQLAQSMADESVTTLGFEIDRTEFVTAMNTLNYRYFSLSADYDKDGILNLEDNDDDNDGVEDDDDGDGVVDQEDAFPLDSDEAYDYDQDGIGNNADDDDDNDDVPDAEDDFPLDETEHIDTDIDGIGNNSDTDDDGDGIADEGDAFPLDNTESSDYDKDGIGDNADPDADNDGVIDEEDDLPLDETESIDTDLDGIGNNKDEDDDNDGFADNLDAFPLDENEWLDTDGDGIGNNIDSDDDNDGVYDNDDDLPLDKTDWQDFDHDGIGDITDNDDDNDTILDGLDYVDISAPIQLAFTENEWVLFKARGFDEKGERAIANDGWHVQYYITDKDKGKQVSFYTNNNFYNGQFSESRQEWLVRFPAPSYSGNFEIEISVYCSLSSKSCGDENDNGSIKRSQIIDFEVTCTLAECGYQPVKEPGRNISASSEYNRLVDALQMSNGDMIAAYVDFTEANWMTHI